MLLKVLYTFDAEHKHNCLARWSQTVQVRTAHLDGSTQIGIIDLKTCVQAMTASSPELISKLDTDYTIYAFDYSEEGTPLVGQGLLSWAMSSNSEEEVESTNMVTGRVTRGLLGLFTRNAQETLEVKLRLTHVPSSTQNDYLSSLQKYKEASNVIGQDFDAQAWTNFLQNNPGFTGRPQSAERSMSPMDKSGLEYMQRMLHEGTSPREATAGISDPFINRPASRPSSRNGPTNSGQPFYPPPRQQSGYGSRPNSRQSMQPISHQRRDSFNSGYYSAEETIEDGPAKKRAKTTKVRQPSKSELNIERQPDSLRVAASTASSVRLHRPTAVNPALALQTGTSAEEPVRPPTPIPKIGRPRGRPRKEASSLRSASNAQPSSPIPAPVRPHSRIRAALSSPVLEPDHPRTPSQLLPPSPSPAPAQQQISAQTQPTSPFPTSIETQLRPSGPAVVSPAETRADTTSSSPPANIPSSPPMMPHYGPTTTSPALPPMSGMHDDSGFMSGVFDDVFDDGNMVDFGDFVHDKYYENNAAGGNEVSNALNHERVLPEGSVDVSDSHPAELRPPPIPNKTWNHHHPGLSRAHTSQPAPGLGLSSPHMDPTPLPELQQTTEEIDHLEELPGVAASDPVGRPMHRSNTWAGDMSDMPMSEGPIGPLGQDPFRKASKKKIGKEATKARLETAIATGEMPPFCDNCGAIETPAWRRAYAKTFECPWEEVETSLLDGDIVFKEPLEHNEDGSIKRFRGFKISRTATDRDDEWLAIQLCNRECICRFS